MKKKIILISAAVIALAAICIIGYTLAYFTDTKTVTNTFTIGNVIILLDEAPLADANPDEDYKWETAAGDRLPEGNTYNNIFPGAELPKDPTVTNIGANDAYVRLRVTINNAAAWTAACETHDIELTSIFTQYNSTSWDVSGPELDNDQLTYVYTYKTVLTADPEMRGDTGTTGALFKSVKIPTEFTSEEMALISGGSVVEEDGDIVITYGEEETFIYVTAEAIQAAGFDDYLEAFQAFENQVNP